MPSHPSLKQIAIPTVSPRVGRRELGTYLNSYPIYAAAPASGG